MANKLTDYSRKFRKAARATERQEAAAEIRATPRGLARKAGRGTGTITTRERFALAAAAQEAAEGWNLVSFPNAPEQRLKDRNVGFADGFAAAIRVLEEAGIILELTAKENKS